MIFWAFSAGVLLVFSLISFLEIEFSSITHGPPSTSCVKPYCTKTAFVRLSVCMRICVRVSCVCVCIYICVVQVEPRCQLNTKVHNTTSHIHEIVALKTNCRGAAYRCVLCTVYCVLCTVYCVLCTVYCVLCTVYCVLCTVYCVLCTVYCVLCTVYCVLCTVYCVLCGRWTVDCVLDLVSALSALDCGEYVCIWECYE
jgi:hypothetical protein